MPFGRAKKTFQRRLLKKNSVGGGRPPPRFPIKKRLYRPDRENFRNLAHAHEGPNRLGTAECCYPRAGTAPQPHWAGGNLLPTGPGPHHNHKPESTAMGFFYLHAEICPKRGLNPRMVGCRRSATTIWSSILRHNGGCSNR